MMHAWGVIKVEKTRQENGSFDILLGILRASMLGNILSGKKVMRVGKGVVRARKGYNYMDLIDKSV